MVEQAPDAGGTASGGSAAQLSAGAPSTGPGGSSSLPQQPEGAACYNDTDCPDPACGGQVCNWTKQAQHPDGTKLFYCNAAGTQPDGKDGWCTTDADCKCRGLGAHCAAPYCTFTRLRGL